MCFAKDPMILLNQIAEVLPCADLLEVGPQRQRHVGEDHLTATHGHHTTDLSTYINSMEDHRTAIRTALGQPAARPLDASHLADLDKSAYTVTDEKSHLHRVHLLQKICGQLCWLSTCHPSVTARHSMLASHTNFPSDTALRCALGILEDIHKSGLPRTIFSPTTHPVMRLYVDASLQDKVARRGYYVQISDATDSHLSHTNPIEWRSKQIPVSKRSPADAELDALVTALSDVCPL